MAILSVFVARPACADWPMAGHDSRRSSWAPEDQMPPAIRPLWHAQIEPYIPSRANLATWAGDGGPGLVYVPTAAGVYALRGDDGVLAWHYLTAMPVGHSPTVVGGVLYVGVLDKRSCRGCRDGEAAMDYRAGRGRL